MMNWLIATFAWLILAGSVCLYKKNNGLVDIFWGLGFVILAGVSFFARPEHSLHSFVVTVLVMVWGLRLSGYLFSRNWNKPEDFRYSNWRREWGEHWVIFSILKVYILQGLIMQLIAIPILIVNVFSPASNSASSMSFLGEAALFLGVAIATSGIMIESLADLQKSNFKKRAQSPTEICKVGLWSVSRHPNYLGEILTWIGIGIIPLGLGGGWVALISPALIIFLLYKVSGIPFLEERMVGRPDFEEYKRTTGAIFPKILKRSAS